MTVPSIPALPAIVIGESDEHRLTAMANGAALTGQSEHVAAALIAELERANVVPNKRVPSNVVRMASWVEFEIDGRDRRRVQLVFPNDANIDEDKISVMTPIGTALIGLRAGKSMTLRGHDGRPHRLTVLSVEKT